MIKAVLFDFGGVLAEEGFREGLMAIARESGLEPKGFFEIGLELVYQSGYVTGKSTEVAYWDALRKATGISGSDHHFRETILNRFRLRPAMLEWVRRLRGVGRLVAILSDQTNWLDEIDERESVFCYFDFVFNSYRMGKSKRDGSIFLDVSSALGINPVEGLFVDDNEGNVRRAEDAGMVSISFKGISLFEVELGNYVRF